MDGEFTFLDEFDYGRKAALIRNSYRNMDANPELRQADKVGEVQILEGAVVRYVKKDGLDALGSSHAISYREFFATFLGTLPFGVLCGQSEMPWAHLGCS